jgi:hypothetical protein
MKDDQKKEKKKTTLTKWKTNQSTKFNLIGCDTIVNSPSLTSNSVQLSSWLNLGFDNEC